ncbi:hypothetical protein DNG35_00570 [Mesonia sp. K7]|nr:hypothetical protein DNG35_00570 [Mesonia sp. K7]
MIDLDKAIIISRVAEILKETPSAQEVVKQGKNRQKRFDYLATHMVNKAIEEDALILSEDASGIAILFKMNASKKTLQDRIDELKLVWNVTGFKNALKILDKQKYIKNQRPQTGDYLYCWFWGITKNSRGADTQIGKEMKDEFLRRADKDNIPLYAETAIRKNAIVYQKFGFELFHTWKREDGSKMWFLRYLPNQKG